MSERVPLAVGIVGCGRIGRVHAMRLADDARANVVALFDVHPDMAEGLAADLPGGPGVCTKWAQFLRQSLDAVVICTPTPAHYEQVIDCESAGWHILCEKPLSDSIAAIQELITLSERSSQVLSLGYQRRYWSTFRTIQRELQSGTHGRILSVTYHSTEPWQQTIAGTWRDDPEVNWGGFVGDAGSHKVDILHAVTGLALKSINAACHSFGSSVPIVMTSTGLLTDGTHEIPLSFDLVGNAHHLDEDFHLHCEHADLMVRRKQAWIATGGEYRLIDNPEPDGNPTIAFLDQVLDRAECLSPFSAALPVRSMTEALLRASGVDVETGQDQ